jgi:hypothetical protein
MLVCVLIVLVVRFRLSQCVSVLFTILFIWTTSLAATILVTSGPPQPGIMQVKRSEKKKDALNRTEHLRYRCENKEDERKREKAKTNHCTIVRVFVIQVVTRYESSIILHYNPLSSAE